MKWSVVLLAFGCSSPPPEPQTVVVERIVYVERETLEPERVEPGAPIPESPLLVAAEEHRAERAVIAAPEPEREIVYVPIPVEQPPRMRYVERQRLGRELDRCERRATRFARERCEERARAK